MSQALPRSPTRAPAIYDLLLARLLRHNRRCLAIGAPRADRPHARRNLSFGKLACRLIGGAGSGTVGIEEATMHTTIPLPVPRKRAPWNKGRLIGQKRPLKPKDVWAIRVRLQLQGRKRDLALFNLAIDSKLRGCDLVHLQVDDVCTGGRVRDRGTVIQKRQGDRSSSKSWSRPEPRSMIGCRRSTSGTVATCSRAVSEPNRISLRGNTLASSMPGSRARGSTVRPTAHIQCAGRRWRRFTERPVTFARLASARAYEARKHRPVSRDRGG